MIRELAGGHDFAIVDDRYIVDPWLMEVELDRITTLTGKKLYVNQGVFDLENSNDRQLAREIYGPSSNWTRGIKMENEADKGGDVELD